MLPNPKPFFESLPDPRRTTQNKLHGLSDILGIALCATLSGMDDWEAVAEFGRAKEDWLRQFLPLPNGTPSHDTFGRVFSLIDPEAFEAAFFDWAAHARIGGDRLDQLALDGKTVRRSHRGSAARALHLLHAWSCEARLLVAQRRVDAKANEITALPEILSLFDLDGVTVTIDAIGCQKTVARQITEGGGDYVLALIRRFALNLLRQAKGSKPGVKNKRLRTAYDDAFRASVLQLTPRVHGWFSPPACLAIVG
ncbi:ISAs1 family transposase [Marinobacterium aestuariivivens]|uniref:ISAs1 family transposase n=1 Tax=Marinobacterium aestuariivivens TaxID=1698799 RepID=A0ABW1ZZF8_9GAMM